MDEKNRTSQDKSTASTLSAAAKTGKAVSNIAKGAATGNMYGAALAALKSSKKWLIPVIGLLLIPLVIVAMMPSIMADENTPCSSNTLRWRSRQSAEATHESGNCASWLRRSAFSAAWMLTLT